MISAPSSDGHARIITPGNGFGTRGAPISPSRFSVCSGVSRPVFRRLGVPGSAERMGRGRARVIGTYGVEDFMTVVRKIPKLNLAKIVDRRVYFV